MYHLVFPIRLSVSPHSYQHCSHLFDSSHLSGCEMISHCQFDLHFLPVTNEVKHLFICFLVTFLGKMFSQILYPFFFHWVTWLSALSYNSFLYIVDTSLFSDIWFANIFSSIYVLSFRLLDGVLWSTKVLNFNEIQFIYFFHFVCFWFHI